MSFIDIAQKASNVQGVIGGVRNVLDSVLSFFGEDVVGIFDMDTSEQLFKDARPVKATIVRPQKIMDHPIESGALISDFAVRMPVTIEIQFVLQADVYKAVYRAINTDFHKRTAFAIVVKVGPFRSFIIEDMTHEESTEMFDAIPLTLRFREVRTIKIQYQSLPAPAVQSPTDQSTANRGVQQPKTSILYDIKTSIKNLF